MFSLLYIAFSKFPVRQNAILERQANKVIVEASGSYGIRVHGKCIPTSPNSTLNSKRELDWCSNIPKNSNDCPWISYRIPNKAFKLTGYSVKNGCCDEPDCCCIDEKDIWIPCCCELFSYSLQGSNDNHTWRTIHQVSGDREFIDFCMDRTYDFKETESFNYIRFVLDKQRDGCPKCMVINQIELYGEEVGSFNEDEQNVNEENDESVSIIGKVKRY